MYYGSGYLRAADYWRLGAIFGVIFFLAFLVIGVPWMLFIRSYCCLIPPRREGICETAAAGRGRSC